MTRLLLQIGADPADVPDWLATFVQASDVVSALLGIGIALLAYRGYRRNSSRPMLFIAAGFALALGVPFALLLVVSALPGVSQSIAAVVSQTCQVLGLVSIVYALRMES